MRPIIRLTAFLWLIVGIVLISLAAAADRPGRPLPLSRSQAHRFRASIQTVVKPRRLVQDRARIARLHSCRSGSSPIPTKSRGRLRSESAMDLRPDDDGSAATRPADTARRASASSNGGPYALLAIDPPRARCRGVSEVPADQYRWDVPPAADSPGRVSQRGSDRGRMSPLDSSVISAIPVVRGRELHSIESTVTARGAEPDHSGIRIGGDCHGNGSRRGRVEAGRKRRLPQWQARRRRRGGAGLGTSGS